MVFTEVDVAVFISLFVFVFWQPTTGGSSFSERGTSYGRDWYDLNRDRIRLSPPGPVFGVMWTILYVLIFITGFVFFTQFSEVPEISGYYLAIFVTYFSNLILNKLWSVAFFQFGRPDWSLLVIVLLDVSALAVAIMLGLAGAWLPMGLWIPYVAWILFATYLNLQWYMLGLPSRDD